MKLTHQEDLTNVINMHAPNIRIPKYIKNEEILGRNRQQHNNTRGCQ